MVFLSTCQVLLGYPLTRSVFAFGTRSLMPRVMMEELAVGALLVLPLSLVAALGTKRLAASGWGRPRWVRSDVWTTILITVVGDLFLELLLPSLQCLPVEHPWEAALRSWGGPAAADDLTQPSATLSYLAWLRQAWGFGCPELVDRSDLLSTDAVGTLLTLRLLFMCVGVYLGESFCPVALTGGIACGKSTVARLLVHPPSMQQGVSSSSSAPLNRKPARKGHGGGGGSKSKKAKSFLSASAQSLTSDAAQEEEGSFWIVDTDKIAHEILLPPSVLAAGQATARDELDEDDLEDSDDEDDLFAEGAPGGVGSASGGGHGSQRGGRRPKRRSSYRVSPTDSVYHTVLQTFGDESDNYRNLLTSHNLIDRDKLGAMVFANRNMRRQLNRITHPRIFVAMMKQLFRGAFGSSHDVVCADIPLFFETMGSLRYMFGLVIVVVCSRERQFQRLRQRNSELSEAQCWERINSQLPVDQKARLADLVVWNDGTMGDLSHEVEQVRREVMGRLFGVGMSLLQMLLLVGGSLSLAVSSKVFSSWSV